MGFSQPSLASILRHFGDESIVVERLHLGEQRSEVKI